MFDPTWRARALAGLDRPFDLVVIGGGITGCGILLDAAQRGLRTLLVERHDIAAGTSSRSSKLIHGGLRYLKQLRFGLTRKSVRERDLQLQLSPQWIKPVDFLYPTYAGDRPPAWQIDLGLSIYDRMSRLSRHTRAETDELLARAPDLARENLEGGLVYRDARTDDARLTFAVAATGAAYGGLILTRAEPLALGRGEGLHTLTLRDLETGRDQEAIAATVVNAAGVWADELRGRLGLGAPRIRPSRGSHLLLTRDCLPLDAALAMSSPDDRRPVFMVPHPEGLLVGTTDLFHHGNLDDPRPTTDEIAYLLRAVHHAFPARTILPEHLLGAFAGLRPVLDQGADDPSHASREDALWREECVLTVAGGKLTTWRAMAERVVDRVIQRLPPERQRRAAPCATQGTPLWGLAPPDLADRFSTLTNAPAGIADAMARRLGSGSWIARALARGEDDFRQLAEGVDVCAAEVRFHLRHGAVQRLDDLLLRRVRVGMWQPARVECLLGAVAPLVHQELGWSAQRWFAEVEHLGNALAGWRATPFEGLLDEAASAAPRGDRERTEGTRG